MSKNVVEVFLDGQKLLVRQMEVSYSSGDLPVVSVEAMIPPEPQEKRKEPTLVKGPFKLMWGDEELTNVSDVSYQVMTDVARSTDYDGEITVHINPDGADALAYMLEDYKNNGGENTMCREDEDRCESACAKEDSSYGSHNLAKKLVELDLTDDEKLLNKYNIYFEDGTLTETGKTLLLTVLAEEYTDKMVAKLQLLENLSATKVTK